MADPRPCPACAGTGRAQRREVFGPVAGTTPCTVCDATGRVVPAAALSAALAERDTARAELADLRAEVAARDRVAAEVMEHFAAECDAAVPTADPLVAPAEGPFGLAAGDWAELRAHGCETLAGVARALRELAAERDEARALLALALAAGGAECERERGRARRRVVAALKAYHELAGGTDEDPEGCRVCDADEGEVCGVGCPLQRLHAALVEEGGDG